MNRQHVLIDATVVVPQIDGLSQYVLNLIQHIQPGCWEGLDFSLVAHPRMSDHPTIRDWAHRGGGVVSAPVTPIGPSRDWRMRRFLKQRGADFDLIHVTSNQYPLFLKGGVYTIHDLLYKRYPQISGRLAGLKKRYQDVVIRHGLRRAARVIAVSQYTRRCILEEFPRDVAASDLHVVGEGWEQVDEFPAGAVSAEVPFERYFFYIGSSRHHKNLSGLLEAFRRASPALAGVGLVIVGREDRLTEEQKSAVAQINRDGRRVVLTGYVSSPEAYELFRRASAFVFPSFSEGFGLPLLEAFAFSVPVACSDAGSLPEVAGDAALYFDPHDVDQMADQMTRIMTDLPLRRALIQNGKARLEVYSWERCARQTVALYYDALGRHKDAE